MGFASSHLPDHKAATVMMGKISKLSRISPHHLHESASILWVAVLQGAAHHVARDTMSGQALDVRTDHVSDVPPLTQSPVLEDVLDHKIPKGVAAELRGACKNLIYQTFRLCGRAVFQEPLHHAASVSMSCSG